MLLNRSGGCLSCLSRGEVKGAGESCSHCWIADLSPADALSLPKLYKRLESSQIDPLHTHTTSPNLLPSLLASHSSSSPPRLLRPHSTRTTTKTSEKRSNTSLVASADAPTRLLAPHSLSMPSSSPNLSPELWADIFAFFGPQSDSHSKRTQRENPLLALCLVSRTFNGLARPLLYQEVRVRTLDGLDSVCKSIEEDKTLRPAYLCAIRTTSGKVDDDEAQGWRSGVERFLQASITSVERVTICGHGTEPVLKVSLAWFAAGKGAFPAFSFPFSPNVHEALYPPSRTDTLKRITLASVELENVPKPCEDLTLTKLVSLRLLTCHSDLEQRINLARHLPSIFSLEMWPIPIQERTPCRESQSVSASPSI